MTPVMSFYPYKDESAAEHVEPPRQTAARFFFQFRRIGIIAFRRAGRPRNEQPQRSGIGWTCGRGGKSGKGLRPSQAHLLVQDLRRELAHAGKLRTAAGKNGAPSCGNIEAGLAQTVLN